MTTPLKIPRKGMTFPVLEITKLRTTKVKVTPPFVCNKHFKNLGDFLDQTEEFVKQYSYNECFYWKIEVENKVFWYMNLPEVLLEAVEKRFWEDLFKEARQR